ncbi:hypothetical protein [Pleionea sediminis]|uniref:hypothetical protein n=1 Tax=Pleionea sediminis TaxID=2569479 RepID=UPI001185E9BB|nr:hypothetical protein [Pleionea sediminis]
MSDVFLNEVRSNSQSIATVIKFDFTEPLFITTHVTSGLPNSTLQGCLLPNTSVSQKLNSDESRAEIGSISFTVLDLGLSSELKMRFDMNEGLKRAPVEVYRGKVGTDFSDFMLIQTQLIDNSVSIGDGRYRFQCSDIQRSAKKQIFDLAETTITQTVLPSDEVISVVSTEGFEFCDHTASFGDAPNESVLYLKLKNGDDFEIVRVTGKTETQFTGITRGLFYTTPLTFEFDDSGEEDDQITVMEYVYLEMPMPAMVYALLTGEIIGGGSLPERWHLGIEERWVNRDSFEHVGEDWFDPNNYSLGLIYRFQDLEKTEGKSFIERQLLRMIAYLPIGADGALSLKRLSRVIAQTDYTQTLNASNIIRYSDLRYQLSKVKNLIDIQWNFVSIPNQAEGYSRQSILLSETSRDFNRGYDTLSLKLKGLHNSRQTTSTLRQLLAAFRDRYSFPPFELDLGLLPTVFGLQVGETVRVDLPTMTDPTTDGPLNRVFEVQQVKTSLIDGRVSVKLFASSRALEEAPDDGSDSTLPDSWYSEQGTDASSILSIDGDGFLTADGVLSGSADTRTWYFVLGDLTVPNGRTLTIENNVGLAVMGYFQNDGLVRAKSTEDDSNFIGTTIGGAQVIYRIADGQPVIDYGSRPQMNGLNDTLPDLTIQNNSGTLSGIPEDMRGTAGAQGGRAWNRQTNAFVDGGLGGFGGGSFVLVSRGSGVGVSGSYDLSGDDGEQGSDASPISAGSGGGGAPGSLVMLIDGNTNNYPVLNGKVVAEFGISPTPNLVNDFGQGKAVGVIDLGMNNARVVYVPSST